MKRLNKQRTIFILVFALAASVSLVILIERIYTNKDISISRLNDASNQALTSPTETLTAQKTLADISKEDSSVNSTQNKGQTNQLEIVHAKKADVYGQILDKSGEGIGGMQIEISSSIASPTPKIIYTSTSDDKGYFSINGLPTGDEYQLEVLALGAYAGTVLKPLAVTESMDLVTIVLDSLELISLDGTIVDTDYTPITDFEILVRNIDIAYPGDKIVTDNSGFFQLGQFPVGNIHMSTSGDEHFEVTGITLSPDVYRNLTLILDKGMYGLSGQITDSAGQPIEQARVVSTAMFSGDHYQSSSYRLRVTDKNGNFSFTGLGDWNHKLVIDATGYQTFTTIYSFQTLNDNVSVELQRR